MPGMNGAQLIEELHRGQPRIPVLLVTGYAAKGEDVPSGVPVLSKPFRQADLARMLNELLHRAQKGPKLRML